MCERSSRVSGSMIWNSSSIPMVNTGSLAFIGFPRRLPLFVGDQFASRRLKTPHHHFADALKQFVAESKIFVAMLPQHDARKTNGFARLRGSRIKLPKVGREKPRPSQRFAGRDGIDDYRFPFGGLSLQQNGSRLNQIKPVGWITFAKDDLTRLEFRRHC